MAGKSVYSWEDFIKELDGSGFRGQFSDADMKLAQANPDVGMSLLNYKRQYAGAATDEERKKYNDAANALRSSYGGYTGGVTGGNYAKDPLAPRDFSYDEAPTYQSRYDGRIQELLDALTNRENFSYDAERDPLYAQYRKQYLREGKRASEDTMGQAAAMSGGLPTSYAATAAGQAQNYYNAQLTDKIPELEQLAYQKYLDDFDMDRTKLSAVQSAEQSDYQKYLDSLSQYNTDRDFAYGQFSDELARQRYDRETEYSRGQDARANALEDALLGAQYGDYSKLRQLGYDTTGYQANEERQRALEEAQLRAQYGDFSGLRDLGVDTSAYEAKLAAANAPRTVYRSSPSGGDEAEEESEPPLGTNGWFDYIIAASGETGQSAEDFLRSHKSELGLTESNIKTYAERIEAYRTESESAQKRDQAASFDVPGGNSGPKPETGKNLSYDDILTEAYNIKYRTGSSGAVRAYLNHFDESQLSDEDLRQILNILGVTNK